MKIERAHNIRVMRHFVVEQEGIMTPVDPAKYRRAAEQCRKKAQSFSDSSEWVRFSQEWEKLAQAAQALASQPSATSRLFVPRSTQ